MASKKISSVNLSDIYKRCPSNQIQQFTAFQQQRAEYERRVNKYPEQLPNIDWEYYRKNVRTDYVKMVDEFQKKYAELHDIFESRHSLDTSKYYMELEKKKEEVQIEVDKFVSDSDERINAIREEIERISSQIPREEMTMEEFCESCLNDAPFTYNGQPTFWPHTPEEQMPGPSGSAHGITELEGDLLTEDVMLAEDEARRKRDEEEVGPAVKQKPKAKEFATDKATKELKVAKETQEEKAAEESKKAKSSKDDKASTKDPNSDDDKNT